MIALHDATSTVDQSPDCHIELLSVTSDITCTQDRLNTFSFEDGKSLLQRLQCCMNVTDQTYFHRHTLTKRNFRYGDSILFILQDAGLRPCYGE
jgi:hypothetical protein